MMGGNEISKYYEGLRPAQLDALMAKFAEIDDQGGVPTKQAKRPVQKETIETNIGNKGGVKKLLPKR